MACPLLAHTCRAQLSCFTGTPTASSELPARPLPTPGLGHFKPQVRTACPSSLLLSPLPRLPLSLPACFLLLSPREVGSGEEAAQEGGGRCRAEGEESSGSFLRGRPVGFVP